MDWTETPRERRRTMRVRSKGSVRVRHRACLSRGRIVDLGVAGINVRAELPTWPALRVGEPVHIDIKLDARSQEFSLSGHVLRTPAASSELAIGFDAIPRNLEDCVRDELLAAAKHDAVPHMILVDRATERRGKFANAFRDAGCCVTAVSTPLEAIAQLGHLQFEPGIIAIADSVPESIAEDLRELLSEQHPEAHMVAIGSSNRRRDQTASWLRTGGTPDDLRLRVGRVITAHAARRRSTKSLPFMSRGTGSMSRATRQAPGSPPR